ncbi:MAG: hypothetical protein IT364_19265 [Candidatus Hydrogenedentes bacterium]|nr:hypothetical protein [Candidatus Hydrogenedentota bacterium]
MEVIKIKGKELTFNTDAEKIRKGMQESSKSLAERLKNIENAKYVTQDMLRREVSIL